ncbi:SERINE/THREONINE-PROTEIN KINASE FRAY2 [Salix viminalis]|uniref:SERINE/THREONINE-PROTEIN KINASE FRAY2 n=1 Tax=Salix viminalis TaxID=40686 RepID=A0A9Q0QK41_SALVM|nr:SERINE/THREONINE-PROTEIN KINASE FRAY2 [Salix viminalis]
MVASCLDQDPSRRPSADHLLDYSFFKNCEGLDLLFNEFFRSSVQTTRINGWKFNESKFELEPEFHAESKDDAVKTVRFGGDMEGLILEKEKTFK